MFYTDLHDIILWSDTASDGHWLCETES